MSTEPKESEDVFAFIANPDKLAKAQIHTPGRFHIYARNERTADIQSAESSARLVCNKSVGRLPARLIWAAGGTLRPLCFPFPHFENHLVGGEVALSTAGLLCPMLNGLKYQSTSGNNVPGWR